MSDGRPVLFWKEGCPHCLKVRLFLLEAGRLDDVEQRSFVPGDADEAPIRTELDGAKRDGKIATISFPALKTDDGYMTESDAIIDRLAARLAIDRATLPIFATYADRVLPRYTAARRELNAIKAAG